MIFFHVFLYEITLLLFTNVVVHLLLLICYYMIRKERKLFGQN